MQAFRVAPGPAATQRSWVGCSPRPAFGHAMHASTGHMAMPIQQAILKQRMVHSRHRRAAHAVAVPHAVHASCGRVPHHLLPAQRWRRTRCAHPSAALSHALHRICWNLHHRCAVQREAVPPHAQPVAEHCAAIVCHGIQIPLGEVKARAAHACARPLCTAPIHATRCKNTGGLPLQEPAWNVLRSDSW